MKKTELIAKMAEVSGLSKKDTEKALKAFEDVVTEELAAGGEVRLVGFGKFYANDRPAHMCKNPRTGEPMEVAASRTPGFRVGKGFKDAVNKK